MAESDTRRRHWHANLRITALLLFIWFLVTFGVSYFARELSFSFFGWPFSFWMGAQGTLMVYLLLIGFYAWYIDRLDRRYGVQEEEP